MKKLIVLIALFLIVPFAFAETVTVYNYQTGRYEIYEVNSRGDVYLIPALPGLQIPTPDPKRALNQAEETNRMRLKNELLRLFLEMNEQRRSYDND